jgi:hypothetical protein
MTEGIPETGKGTKTPWPGRAAKAGVRTATIFINVTLGVVLTLTVGMWAMPHWLAKNSLYYGQSEVAIYAEAVKEMYAGDLDFDPCRSGQTYDWYTRHQEVRAAVAARYGKEYTKETKTREEYEANAIKAGCSPEDMEASR